MTHKAGNKVLISEICMIGSLECPFNFYAYQRRASTGPEALNYIEHKETIWNVSALLL